MSTWSRRLEKQVRTPTRAAIELPAEIAEVLAESSLAAAQAVATVADGMPGFHALVPVTFTDGVEGSLEVLGYADEVEFGFLDAGAELELAGSDEAGGEAGDGDHITDMLADTLVLSSDIVAVFSSVGAEAIWANDAFATTIPIREADRTWLIDLLDEWSKGHFEVNVLPALVQHGRWRGQLVLQVGDNVDRAVPVVCSIVAHRDADGEIEAITMVARDIREVLEADARAAKSERPRLAALVEDASDLLIVLNAAAVVQYASPAVTRVLGMLDEELHGSDFYSLVHDDDRQKCDLEHLAEPDEDGVPPSEEIRLRTSDGDWRILDLVAADLLENRVINGVVLTGRDITDRVEAVQRLADRAYTDPLTLLPNRMRLFDRLGATLGTAEEGSVVTMLFDIDGYDEFCTEHGHSAGDEYLRQFSHRLSEETRPNDLVARLEGSTFALVMKGTDVEAALVIADRIKTRLAEPFRIGSTDRSLTISVGVAVNSGEHTAESIVTDADSAVGIAKDAGGDRIEVMTAEIRGSAGKRRNIEELLERAIDDGHGVTVHYQPIIDLESGLIDAAEALLRVHDDEGALLSPGSFLEAAEDTGLIEPLGRKVLQITCQQLASWNALGEDVGAPRHITVNVSPRQLAAPNFADVVGAAIADAGIEADQLWLEITESKDASSRTVAEETVASLREVGVLVGLDDFGSGQSSLGYLRRFPLDFVKIDRGLVDGLGTDEGATAIVRATVEMAHSLGLDVCAVGVENEDQLEILQLLQVDRAQGFYFLPAVSADDIITKLGSTFI